MRIVAALRAGRMRNYTKSDSSMRTVPLDRYTASVVEGWIEEKRRALDEMGLVLRELGRRFWARQATPGATTRSRRDGTRSSESGLRRHAAPTPLRHTFATINLARARTSRRCRRFSARRRVPTCLTCTVGFIPATTRGRGPGMSAGSSRDS